ncbi:MAG: ACT domain-containing protein, partial [Bacteroidota bacterium]
MNKVDFTLILDCPDEKGIISRITEYVYARGGSIDELNQTVDKEDNHFFMRCKVVSDNFAVRFAELKEDFENSSFYKPGYKITFYNNLVPLRAVVFTSRSTHCLFDLFQRSIIKEWNLEI